MFDYKEAQKDVMKGLDVLNINGRNMARRALEYLEVCPFFEVVAKHLEVNVDTLYQKMKYYLGEEKWKSLREDVRIRRIECMGCYKESLVEKLKIMDEEQECTERQG
jgi:hypothetical protein